MLWFLIWTVLTRQFGCPSSELSRWDGSNQGSQHHYGFNEKYEKLSSNTSSYIFHKVWNFSQYIAVLCEGWHDWLTAGIEWSKCNKLIHVSFWQNRQKMSQQKTLSMCQLPVSTMGADFLEIGNGITNRSHSQFFPKNTCVTVPMIY